MRMCRVLVTVVRVVGSLSKICISDFMPCASRTIVLSQPHKSHAQTPIQRGLCEGYDTVMHEGHKHKPKTI